MQFKKAQHEMIENIVELSDDINLIVEEKTPTHTRIFMFNNNPNKILVFKKRGNHRYWYLIDKKEFENTKGGDTN